MVAFIAECLHFESSTMFCKRAHLPDFSLLIFFQVGAQNPWLEWANYPLQLDQFSNLAARQGAHASQRGKQGNAHASQSLSSNQFGKFPAAQHQVSQTLPLCRNGQCKFCVFFGGGRKPPIMLLFIKVVSPFVLVTGKTHNVASSGGDGDW